VKLAAWVVSALALALAAGLASARPSKPDCGEMHVAGTPAGSPAVAGRCDLVEGRPVFVPAFPLAAGVSYVTSHSSGLTTTTTVPPKTAARTTTVQVYPTSGRVPANLLKLYLEFSTPMSIGEAGQRVRLRDARGTLMTGAFLALDEEMWDAERRRLTILFDPGRVKRGLRTNLEAGAPLTPGETYSLEVDEGWVDAAGATLASGITKRFVAVSPDRVRPAAARWVITAPRTNTREPLAIAFGEILDAALLRRAIRVVDRAGVQLEGSISLHDGERAWRFAPAEPWARGDHLVEVDPRLEDLAGNNLYRLFDADLSHGATRSRPRFNTVQHGSGRRAASSQPATAPPARVVRLRFQPLPRP
jgi:hypothetical protein